MLNKIINYSSYHERSTFSNVQQTPGIRSVRKYQNMFQCVWSLSENGKEPSIKWKIVKMVSTIKQLYLSAN